MEKLEIGETAVLENNKEFICFSRIQENGNDYIYLISNYKPLEIKFAKQNIVNGELELTIIENQEEKEYVYNLFQEKIGTSQNNN